MHPVTRRSLMSAIPALALSPLRAAEAATALPLKLGVATYSLRKLSRPQAIDAVKQLGTPYVSIKEYHLPYKSTPEEWAQGRREFENAGLTTLSGGNNGIQKDTDEDVRFFFDYAKACGMPMLVIAPTHQTLPRVEKFVKQYDLRVAIHNHGPEDKHFPSPRSVLDAIKGMDPRVGLCIDVGHTVRTGADVVESIRQAGSRLFDMHVKDLKDLRDSKSQCAVGEGAIPFVTIFKQLIRMKYQGGVMLEYEIHADNPLPGMLQSFAYMRGVLAGLRG
ncbi:MAG: sugar phosphate isomerase/epimerase family protein [Bryobacteraceae bacterium]